MSTSMELPDCHYPMQPITITPCAPTPKHHSLYLSDIDDRKDLRFTVPYVYLYKKCIGMDTLKSSLSRVLVDYYPLAGRLRISTEDENKLVVDCNGEGVVFAEASMDITAQELLKASMMPNMPWEKFMCKVEAKNVIDHPPLVIQVTSLRCGGIILCASIFHCLCDGTGASLFLNAWAQLTKNPIGNLTIVPSHERQILKNREPLQVNLPHPIFTKISPEHEPHFLTWLKSQSRVPTLITFGANEVIRLKKLCTTSSLGHITTFEAVAAHTWRSFVKSLDLPLTRIVKLCFTSNFRKKMKIPKGYYGNGFVVTGVESTVKDLVVDNNLDNCVKLVQQAKALANDEEYIKSTIDVLKDKTVDFDGFVCLLISQWNKLGLEDVDFGEGKPLHLAPSGTNIYCLFLPVIGDPNAVRVLFSVPKSAVEKFQHYMMEI